VLDTIAQIIEQSGAWMYLLAPLFMVVVAVLPIPAEIPAMLNGMIFGTVVGGVITWSGAVVGAVISFELACRFGRPLAERLASRETLAKTDRVALSAGWPALVAARLFPLIAFTALNWGAGLTAIPRWTFGIVPGVILFTASGSGLAAFYRRNPGILPLLVALFAVVVVFTVSRYRRGRGRTGAVAGLEGSE
jgi:uncharacterized membrane protein YdjX (TVP38/TMEM64 family)